MADRPRDPAKWTEMVDIVNALSIPVIANGDVFEYEDFERIKDATGMESTFSLLDIVIDEGKCFLFQY